MCERECVSVSQFTFSCLWYLILARDAINSLLSASTLTLLFASLLRIKFFAIGQYACGTFRSTSQVFFAMVCGIKRTQH